MRLIDQFIPQPDVRDEHHIDIHAPAALVLDVATKMDIQALPIVHALIEIRAMLMRAKDAPRKATALLDELLGLGWRVLAHVPERSYVLGAIAQPWNADPAFRGVDADRFVSFDQPDMVKIVATLEAEPLSAASTRFTTETRVEATDPRAFWKFRRYWVLAAPGIILIRLAMLRALKHEAEEQYRRHVHELGQLAA